MANFLFALVGLGMIGAIVFVVLLVISFIKKKPKRVNAIGLAICFVAVIVASLAYPDSELEDYRARQEEKKILAEQERVLQEQEAETSRQNHVESLLDELRKELPRNVGQGEIFESVAFDARQLIITIDITKHESIFSDLDVADSRTVSLTDEVLRNEELDDYWDSVTVSFRDLGYITFSKSDIVNGEYGRYFDIPIDFKLTQ